MGCYQDLGGGRLGGPVDYRYHVQNSGSSQGGSSASATDVRDIKDSKKVEDEQSAEEYWRSVGAAHQPVGLAQFSGRDVAPSGVYAFAAETRLHVDNYPMQLDSPRVSMLVPIRHAQDIPLTSAYFTDSRRNDVDASLFARDPHDPVWKKSTGALTGDECSHLSSWLMAHGLPERLVRSSSYVRPSDPGSEIPAFLDSSLPHRLGVFLNSQNGQFAILIDVSLPLALCEQIHHYTVSSPPRKNEFGQLCCRSAPLRRAEEEVEAHARRILEKFAARLDVVCAWDAATIRHENVVRVHENKAFCYNRCSTSLPESTPFLAWQQSDRANGVAALTVAQPVAATAPTLGQTVPTRFVSSQKVKNQRKSEMSRLGLDHVLKRSAVWHRVVTIEQGMAGE